MKSQTQRKPVRSASPARAGCETILVADDYSCLRDVAAAILERCGYRVLTAGCGIHAREVARKHPEIELLLTDLEMPRMGGEELALWFRANRPGVEIVAMSADSRRLRTLDGCWQIEKPFVQIDTFIKTIRDAFEHRHLALQNTRKA